MTPSRRAVVGVVAKSHRALTLMQVLALAQADNTETSRATVRRTLEKLVELRLVQTIHNAGDCHRYVAIDDDYQLLVICRQCGLSEGVQNERLMGLFDATPTITGVAALIAVGSSVAGLYASYYASVSSGAAIVLICTLVFIVVWLVRRR